MKKTIHFQTFIIVLMFSGACAASTLSTKNHKKLPARGVVVAASEIASKVGASILNQGGNAIDAAVAIGFTEAVTLPRAGNIGGGGFMLIWLHKKQRAVAINYREIAPASASQDMFINQKGQVDYKQLRSSYRSSGIPGTVAGLIAAEKHYGKLSLKQVISPAVKLAHDGFIVDAALAQSLKKEAWRLNKDEATHKVFFKPDGKSYQAGDLMKRPELAKSLSSIMKKGKKGFYSGTIAKKIVSANKKYGGLITLQDLTNYHAQWIIPIQTNYRGYTVISISPPSSGGVTLIEMLNILSHYKLSRYKALSPESIHLMTESINLAYRDRNLLLGDPQFVKIPMKLLLSKAHAKSLSNQINLKAHTPSSKISAFKSRIESRQTTHFSVIDREGNMVSNPYTLNYSYGNAQVIPGTGILMNNEMLDFTSKPGTPNPYGLIEGKANAIAPGKQPLSSMTPTFIINKKKKTYIATGSPGGSRIITSLLQFIINFIDFKQTILQATQTPRIHSQLWPDTLYHETGIPDKSLETLKKMGHQLNYYHDIGNLQTAALIGGQYSGYSDRRRPGGTTAFSSVKVK